LIRFGQAEYGGSVREQDHGFEAWSPTPEERAETTFRRIQREVAAEHGASQAKGSPRRPKYRRPDPRMYITAGTLVADPERDFEEAVESLGDDGNRMRTLVCSECHEPLRFGQPVYLYRSLRVHGGGAAFLGEGDPDCRLQLRCAGSEAYWRMYDRDAADHLVRIAAGEAEDDEGLDPEDIQVEEQALELAYQEWLKREPLF
jgi:hypothetical protein